MPDDYWKSAKREALHKIRVEELELSESALWTIKRTGISTVGDCVDCILLLTSGNTLTVRPDVWQAMESEVIPRLEEHGYWPPADMES